MQSTKSDHQDYIFKKLLVISDCNQDFENQVVLLSSILRDLNALFELTQKGAAWRNLLQELLTALKLEKEVVSRFQQKLLNFTTLQVKKLIVSPSGKLSADRTKCLFAVRGLIVLWHLDHGNKISSVLLGQLDVLFKAKNTETVLFIEKISLSVGSFVVMQAEYPPSHKWFNFISTLINSLQAVEIGPSLNHKSSIVEFSGLNQNSVESNSAASNAQALVSSKSKKTYTPIHGAGDLFRYNLSELNLLYRKEFSGIPNLFSDYHPDELLQFVPGVVKAYESNHDDVNLAFLLCLIMRCHVSRYHLITLYPDSGSNVWLNLDQGFLVWNRLALIATDDEVEPVNIPLPLEIVNGLTEKVQQRPNSKTLGDLFGEQLPSLKKLVRKFTFTNSISSHRPFVTRMHFSYGRFILHLCKDEVYAAAISVDFSLAVTANFNYVVLEPTRINKICEDVYRKLGFSGEFLNPVITAVGSWQGQEIDKIVNLLNRALDKAQTSFSGVHNRSNLDQLILAHNQIVFSLTLLIAITCGLRNAREYSLCNHTLDIKNGLMLINDKASTEYLSCRLIPIPELTLQWVLFYKNWLKSLVQRMLSKSKRFSTEIASLCAEECSLGGIPLLFYFHRGEIKPVGSKHIHLLKTFAKPPKLKKSCLTDQITFEYRQFIVFLAIIE